jgi:hypothetical protein
MKFLKVLKFYENFEFLKKYLKFYEIFEILKLKKKIEFEFLLISNFIILKILENFEIL